MVTDIEVEVEELSSEELQQGNAQVWVSAFVQSVSSTLNPLIRTYMALEVNGDEPVMVED
jgi:hypothetical protein